MSKVPANRVRREVMGDAFVERAMGNTTPFTQPLQDLLINMPGALYGSVRGLLVKSAVLLP